MNPVIGIDVAKGKSVATACTDLHKIFCQFSFLHTVSGLRQMQEVLEKLEQTTGERPQAVLEATGQYSMPLYRYFQENHYVFHVVNPVVASKFSRCGLRKIKTDKIDSLGLCRFYYSEIFSKTPRQSYEHGGFRALSRACNTTIRNTARLKTQLKGMIDRCFPGYEKLLDNRCVGNALALLQLFPHPDIVKKTRMGSVALKVGTVYKRHTKAWCQKKAAALRELAEDCYPSVKADDIQVRLLVDMAKQVQQQSHLVEDLKSELVERMKPHPQFGILASIPGFSEYLTASFLAEIGDVRQFNSDRQLIAFCGTDPSVFQSGSFTGNRQHLTKHGNTFLRSTLYMTVVGMVNYRLNPVLLAYYEKKRLREGKPYKVAIFACVNKLLRIIFALSTREEKFSA